MICVSFAWLTPVVRTHLPPFRTPMPRHAPCHRSLHCRRSVSVFITVSHFISKFIYCFIFASIFYIYYIFSFCLNFSSFFIVFIFVFFLLRFSFCATAGLEMMPAELTEDSSSNTPNLVIIGISLAAFGFLLVNAALVAWFFVHQRRKKGSLTLHFMFISISFYKPFTLMFSLKIFYRLFEFITFSCLFSIIEL